MATLLTICTRALDDISSFNVPTYFIGNDDDTAKSLVSAAFKVGEELVRDYVWQECIRTATVTTVDATSVYNLESDYDRMVSDTMWDGTTANRMGGNATSRQWARATNLTTDTALNYMWRLYRNQIQLEPAADGVFSFNYEYLSKSYCESSAGVDRTDGWVDDTDVPLLPADLFIAGIRYYFSKSKNLPYGDASAEYEAIIESRSSKNTPSRAVNMAGCIIAPGTGLSYRPNIPDMVDA